ncbi:MAG: 23S rRNA (uracil(1939)-C(5))-methyltransferase RlmD [Thermoleophilia bacterium]|nr:23S rRNA (uracil(1939)-C(5))-methyltransferase RlmD [Thermoleophilia bacterium]
MPSASDSFIKPGSPLRKGELVDLQVTGLAFGGRGIAKADDFVVFVDGALPGDVVRVRVTKVKKRYAEARCEELLTPSPLRRPPRCSVFGVCGGCVWQNLEYNAQLAYKAQQVCESLEHLGGLRDFELRPIIGMAEPWRYRNRADFAVGNLEGRAIVGFRPRGRWDSVLPLEECHLLHPALEEVRRVVQAWLRDYRIPGWNPRDHSGFVRHLLVRTSPQTGETLVSLVTAPLDRVRDRFGKVSELPGATDLIARLTYECSHVVGILHAINEGAAELSFGLPSTVLWGRPYLRERVVGVELHISVDAFFQTNTLMAHALYELIAEEAGLVSGPVSAAGTASQSNSKTASTTEKSQPVVWDLYCGVGSIGLPLARQARAVLGIELSPQAVADARKNARLNNLTNTHFLAGDVAMILKGIAAGEIDLPSELAEPDVVVVDPPRAGLSNKAVERIAAVGAPRLVYVSCNPTTMAPNVAQLAKSGYVLKRVTPVDMFPHTPHVEAVALLVRQG